MRKRVVGQYSVSFIVGMNQLLRKAYEIFSMVVGAGLFAVSMQLLWFFSPDGGWNPYKSSMIDHMNSSRWGHAQMDLRLWLTPVVAFILIYLLRALIRFMVKRFAEGVYEGYIRKDSYTYLAFALPSLAAFGLYIQPFIIFLVFAIWNILVFIRSGSDGTKSVYFDANNKFHLLLFPFFVSGFAALIYQIIWQRQLYVAFGVNIESVTVIVSIFMLGLGVGALFGGWVSKKIPGREPLVFFIAELCIAGFGVFSLQVIRSVAELFVKSTLVEMTLATYVILFFPTLFMGATLPLLVNYINRFYSNVGKSVSILYFVNTAGSATAAFFTVNILLFYFGLQFSVLFAALLNIFSGAVVYYFIRHTGVDAADTDAAEQAKEAGRGDDRDKELRVKYILVLLVSFFVGYISLSQEILWVRILGFMTGSRSSVFGIVLGFFLIGIAAGSIVSGRVIKRYSENLLGLISLVFILSGLIYYFLIGLSVNLSALIGEGAIPLLYISAGLIAFLMGVIFPVTTHFGIRTGKNVGSRVSFVYFANIVGSTLGPIVTGFYLLDRFGLRENILLISLGTVFLGVVLAFYTNGFRMVGARLRVATALGALLLFVSHGLIYNKMYEKLFYKHRFESSNQFTHTFESRSGIINIEPSDKPWGDDMILGGGVFDGRFSTSLVNDRNDISRAYMLGALHPDPQEVLEIGVSGGAWSRVLSLHKGVKKLDCIEINPAYLDAISLYPAINPILDDPKVNIIIDDGRRWLTRNPEKKYDFILMNTTFFWRSQSNNLVSIEFLRQVKGHLKPGGVFFYNTTGSWDIPVTAAQVFKYVLRYHSFIAVSDSPFPADTGKKKAGLSQFIHNDIAELSESNKVFTSRLYNLANVDLSNQREAILGQAEYSHIITDDNVASEYKTGFVHFSWKKNWFQLF